MWCKYESDSHRIWQHKSTKHRTLSNWHFSCGQWRHFDVSIKSSRAICRIEYLCFECKLREKKLLPIWFHQVQQKAPIEAFSSIEFYSPKKGKHKLKLFKSKKKKHIQPRERTIPLSINKTKRERGREKEREIGITLSRYIPTVQTKDYHYTIVPHICLYNTYKWCSCFYI